MINTTKDRWSALSLRNRADLIKLYTDNGITNIKEIRKHYNSFATGGPIEELEPSVVEDYTKAIEEGEQAIQFVKDYYKSDAYKQRAKAAGLPTRNPLRNRKYKFRDDLTTNESFTRLRTNIGLQPSEKAFYEYYDDIGNVAAHEYAHWNKFYNKRPLAKPEYSASSLYYGNDYSRVYGFMPILEVINPINNHDAEMSESYSDLIGLRYLMQKHGIFDSMDPNAKFNEANYESLLKDKRYKNDRFLKYHTKDQVIKAINDVAFLTDNKNFENLS